MINQMADVWPNIVKFLSTLEVDIAAIAVRGKGKSFRPPNSHQGKEMPICKYSI